MQVRNASRPVWEAACLLIGLALAPAVRAEVSGAAGVSPMAPPPASSGVAPATYSGALSVTGPAKKTAPVVAELKRLAQAPEGAAPADANAASEPSSGGSGRGGIRISGSAEFLGWATINGSMKQGIFSRNNANSDFIVTHFHPKLTAPLGPKAFVYAELCITHPRVGPQPEQAYIEYDRCEWLNVQAGRFLVPLGQWNLNHDVFDHKSIAYPLMYLGHEEEELALQGGPRPIVSTGYTDIGVLAYGSVWPGSNDQIWYGGYVCNGRFGGTDIEWLDLWNTVRDNNSNKALGGRLVWTHGDNLSIGGSYQAGRYDVQNKLRYQLQGVDLYCRVAKRVNIRAEYLRNPVDSFTQGYKKTGWYVSADTPVGKKHEVVVMYSRLRESPAQRVEEIARTTVGFNTFLTRSLKLKTELDFLDLGPFVGDPTNASDAQFGTSFRDTTRVRASLVAIF
jgi:hypothetical protein